MPPLEFHHRYDWWGTIAIAFVLGLAYWAYSPGLTGDFHFDDYPNLGKLGEYGGVTSLDTLLAYLKSGIAGPTGRPISLLSFLLDADDWPASPRRFLRTNILIHLLNGLALCWAVLILLRNSDNPQLRAKATLTAVLTTSVWLLHPYLVSTTLYAVQRMTQLSSLFSLLGLVVYLKGRESLRRKEGQRTTALLWTIAAVVAATALSTLSKENGILLPLLILVVEGLAVRALWGRDGNDGVPQAWLHALLVLPGLVVVGYLISRGVSTGLFEPSQVRPFTLAERLLTQPRVIFEYLSNLLVPRPWYPGLFREHYPISHSLTEPPFTGAYLLALAALPLLALSLRRKAPLVATGVLFFLVGHLVESSTIMLELFFDHRNYLPSVFLFLAPAVWLTSERRRWLLAIVIPFALSILTTQHASLWGRPQDLYVLWSQRNPDSVRAQIAAASRLVRGGHLLSAEELVARGLQVNPDSAALNILGLSLHHSLGRLTDRQIAQAVDAVESGPFELKAPRIMEARVDSAVREGRTSLPPPLIHRLFVSFLGRADYSSIASARCLLLFEQGRLWLYEDEIPQALTAFDETFAACNHVDVGLRAVGLLASSGLYRDACRMLAASERMLRQNPMGVRGLSVSWYMSEIHRLDGEIASDSQRGGRHPVGPCVPGSKKKGTEVLGAVPH